MQDIEEMMNAPKITNENKVKMCLQEVIELSKNSSENVEKIINKVRNKYKIMPSKSEFRYVYEKYFSDKIISKSLSQFMIKKSIRSRSGVLVSTIVLKPDVFSCPKKCSYCPTETDLEGNPTQPKSYLSSEPAMLRALQYNFDVRGQLWDRIRAYIKTGNIHTNSSCKLEIIISGGTWESYPYDYRNQVMNELYWGANTYENERPILSIEEEIKINETGKFRIIGLTIETRPDFITNQSIQDYRRWGVTRVQIGVQHYDDNILQKINRDCTTKDTISAIKKLKDCGFKIVCHLMPDLPGSSPELDKWMFDQSIHNPDLQFDDVKVYPTAVCQSSDKNLLVKSDISEWYKQGLYLPYAEKNLKSLIDVLKYYKKNIQPWVRIQRLVRDIPKQSIEVGYERISNLRQIIQDEMKKEGDRCRCIRCMEIGDNDHKDTKLVVREYNASDGIEYHISIEHNNDPHYWIFKLRKMVWNLLGENIYYSGDLNTYKNLVGFCRLRLSKNPGIGILPELKDCALIREVHVYGHSLGIGNVMGNDHSSQHKGYGKLLVKTAEEISTYHNYKKVAVIAGVGTREYYKNKCGYHLEGTYMVKNVMKKENTVKEIIRVFFFFFVFFTVLKIIFF